MANEQGRPSQQTALPFSYALYDALGLTLTLAAVPLLPLVKLTKWGAHLGERFGRLPAPVDEHLAPLWIHAASVGEVLAAEPLIRELKEQRPGLPVFLTTTSVPGREAGAHRSGADAVFLAPLDVGWLTDRIVQRIRPRALVLIETELWPALIRSAARSGVPVIMVSGRVSSRSAARYARVGKLVAAMLQQVDLFLMQSAVDAERICALGAPAEKVRVIGNLKFARQASTVVVQDPGDAWVKWLAEAPLLVAASTHSGEEELALQALARVWQRHPSARLLLAPRRPERFNAVAGLLRHHGIRAVRRSQARGQRAEFAQVILLDTVGELPNFLPIATAVFVGGTFDAKVGGHNVLEPAVFGKPVAFGPHTDHVAEAAKHLLAARAAEQVHSAEDLAAHWERLLRHPELAREMGLRGREVVAGQRDVAARYAAEICRCIEEGRTSP